MASYSDLLSKIYAVKGVNLTAAITARTCSKWYKDKVVVASTGGLKYYTNYIYLGYCCSSSTSLKAYIIGNRFDSGTLDLVAELIAILPKTFQAVITPSHKSSADLGAVLTVVEPSRLYADIFAWQYPYLKATIKGYVEDSYDIRAYIQAQFRKYTDLQGLIHGYTSTHLGALLTSVKPKDLMAQLKVWSYLNLGAAITGWSVKYLQAYGGGHYPEDLIATIKSLAVLDLAGFIKGTASTSNVLGATIKADHNIGLGAVVNRIYSIAATVLRAHLEAMPMYLLGGSVYGWAEIDLHASISSTYSKDFLLASIHTNTNYTLLRATVNGLLGSSYRGLIARLSGWQYSILQASVYGIESNALYASLTVLGGSKALNAVLAVQTTRYLETYAPDYLQYVGLRATIGYTTCKARSTYSTYTTLKAGITAKPSVMLRAYVQSMSRYTNQNVGIKGAINTAQNYVYNTYLKCHTFDNKPSSIIASHPTFYRNDLILTFKVIKGYHNLIASVGCVPIHTNLSANIQPVLLSVRRGVSQVLYTEDVVSIKDSIEQYSCTVDVSLVHDKLYFVNNKIFSYKVGKPLEFDFVKRKTRELRRYRLSSGFFASSDEAIRYGIVRVLGTLGSTGLCASVTSVNKVNSLYGSITCFQLPEAYTKPFIQIKKGAVFAISTAPTCINYYAAYVGAYDFTASVVAIH